MLAGVRAAHSSSKQTMAASPTSGAQAKGVAPSEPHQANRSQRPLARRRRPAALALLAALCLLGSGAFGQTPASNATSSPPATTASTTEATTPSSSASSTLAQSAPQTTSSESSLIGPSAPVDAGASLDLANSGAGHRLKPVNFSAVDELFEAALESDEELVQRWRRMDAHFQEGVRSILKLIFPQIVALSQDAKVGGDCSGGILKWILSLRNLRSWAIKMLDATGKPSAGIFQGSLTMMGNYRQCLSVRAPDEDEIEITEQFEEYFRGQFCVLHLRPHLPRRRPFYHLNSTIEPLLRRQYKYYEKTLYDELAEIAIAFQFIDVRLDLCVPSTCTRADIQRVAELLSRKLEFRAKVLRCDTEPRQPAGLLLAVAGAEQTQLWLAGPLLLVALSLLASLIVLARALLWPAPEQRPPSGNSCKLGRLVYALSLQATLARLLKTPNFADQPKWPHPKLFAKPWPLYGLRNLFLVWYIIVQMTIQLKYQYLRESLVLRDLLLNYWPFQVIINTSMIFESLILITAFTYGYCHFHSTASQLFANTLAKCLRILPAMVTLIVVTILTPSLNFLSPVWRNFVDEQADVCKSKGYLNLFFLQNFISYNKICIPHSWLLCVELQLIVLTIPLLLLLKKTLKNNPTLGGQFEGEQCKQKPSNQSHLFSDNLFHLLKSNAGPLAILAILAGVGVNFFTVYTNSLPPSWFNTFPDADHRSLYFGLHLAKTWAHLSTFLLGLLGGHLCRSTVAAQQQATGMIGDNLSSGEIRSDIDGGGRLSARAEGSLSTSTSNTQLAKSASSSTLANDSSPASSRGLVISVPRTAEPMVQPEVDQVVGRKQRSAQYKTNLLQMASIVCMLAITFSTYNWSTQQLPSPLVSALYDSLSRLVWSLALVGLMIQLCLPKPQTNNLTRFAQLLSCQTSIVFGRLSLLAYLWAPYVHTFILAVQEQALFPSLFLIFHVIIGNIVITFILAFIMSISIERPLGSALSSCIPLLSHDRDKRSSRLE